ncbi:MAG: hypothetical protein K8S13_10705 [Desulfobacula sp.]|uniref:hypothetical protein n=1 Tax=Desulfobacula sp. TaxID=2593537 RepID=UPI0025BC7336|nr:hypothetical protein [Desulfobacula sp.]MCD4720309.1 hypothetical protein [Desulfobacula sp.]
MLNLKQYKCITWIMLVFFTIFLFDNACFAKANYPRFVKINLKMDATIKVKRVRGRIIPIEIKIKNRTFKFKKKYGKSGFELKTRDMTKLSPVFKDRLASSVTQLGLYRVKTLVKGDKAKAREIIDQHKKIKRGASLSQPPEKLMTRLLERSLNLISSIFINEAHAAGSPVDKQLLSQLNKGYNTVLNSQCFVYPQVQPGIGGWDLLNEENEGGGEEEGEGEEEDKSWYDKLLDFLLQVVIVIAPIAAIVFLCTNPLTLASVLLSFALANGAVTGAYFVTETFSLIGDLLTGKPIIEVTDWSMHSTADGVTITDNSWSW